MPANHVAGEGRIAFGGHRTWYRVTGDLSSYRLPVVLVHGGPGFTHDYLDAFRRLAEGGRAIVHYDQTGNGRSSRIAGAEPGSVTLALFVSELGNLLDHLGLADRFALLGHSFGAIVAAEHAMARPRGLKALVLANAYASMNLFAAGAAALRARLPEAVQEALDRNERAGTMDSAEYQQAMQEFFVRHVCRVPPPSELVRSLEAWAADPTVFLAMHGPSLFRPEGALRSWSAIGRLDRIEAPTLVFRGAHDEASEAAMRPFIAEIPDVRYRVFEESSHLPHIEEPAACIDAVRHFLEGCDRP